MKTYFRLLSFAKPIEKFAIPYIIVTLLAILFNTALFTAIGPLLETLFVGKSAALTKVQQSGSLDIIGQINDFIAMLMRTKGKLYALRIICIAIIVLAVLSNAFRYLSQRYMEDLRVHTLLNLRKTVFNSVMRLNVGYFNTEKKGDIVSKISSDVQVVQFTVTNTLQVLFKEPIQLLAYLFVLLSISVKLTLFSLLIIPVAGFVISRIVKRLKQQTTNSHESFAKMIGLIDEAISGIKIIKAFNATENIKTKFNDENKYYSNLNRKIARRQQSASPVSQALGILVVSSIVYYGGALILTGEDFLSPSKFLVYIATFSQVMQPIKAISNAFSGIHSGITAGERVLGLIDTQPAFEDKPDAKNISSFNKSIIFKGVDFTYGEHKILNNLSLEIKKGTTVALVGPSGGGKSTLMDLIPRFHDPVAGTITIDGLPYTAITAESLRTQMGIVNQDSFLFNDTIFNNIAFGKPDATEQEVIQAAKIANAHNFIIGTQDGYQTNVGDRGNKLSGGQRQRICIARAVLTNPPIMLLDEATSALDTESEKLVQEALNNLMQNRTSVIIAHRLSTIQHADCIVVIEKGQIVEQGTHSQLLDQKGLYARLIEMQTFND